MTSSGKHHQGLKNIAEGWTVKRLGDLFRFKNGINAGKESYGKGVRFINVMEVINNDSIRANDIPGSVVVNEKQCKEYAVRRGDVLFNRTSETTEEIGLSSVYLDDEDVVFGGFVIRARPITDDLLDDYKKYCFRSTRIRSQIFRNGQGAIRTNIGQADLENVLLAFPKDSAQQRIADIIGSIDKQICSSSKLIALKSRMQSSLMEEICAEKKRLKGFSVPFDEVQLGDLFMERNEINRPGLPLLSITRDKGVVLQSESEKKDNSNADKSNYKRICPGDIGYNTMRMWQGRSAISRLEGIVSPAYTVVVPNERADGDFFAYLFKTKFLIHLFFRHSQGLVGDTLNCKFTHFAKVKIKVPSTIAEQQAIARVFIASDREIMLLKRRMELLRRQKTALIQLLCNGPKDLFVG